MLTLITCANSGKYFKFLKQILNNVVEVSSSKNIQIRIIVYNLGMNKSEIEEIKQFKYVTLENFNFNKYPEHVSLEKYHGNNCSYAWKPIIIYDVCEKYGGLLHWLDTRNLYIDFNNLIEILKNEYIYTPLSSGTIKKWTHPTCLEYINGYKYEMLQCRNAAVIGINYDIKWVKEFIKEWKELSLIKECICPDGSDRSNHRQDQAILSILFYKYKDIYNFKDICHFIDVSIHNSLNIRK
tara:strand:+ start:586 stop:1302 length:717 start_codon:yes stop_codon:yes gene_type:complete